MACPWKWNTAPAQTGWPHIEMIHPSNLPPIEWAGRVNQSWFVRGGLDEHAAEWMRYLMLEDDGRLLPSCEAARKMCEMRGLLEDPKPWFYAGLFSQATTAEARRFIATHPVTQAAVPSMQSDEGVVLWLDHASPEIHELVRRLLEAIHRIASQ